MVCSCFLMPLNFPICYCFQHLLNNQCLKSASSKNVVFGLLHYLNNEEIQSVKIFTAGDCVCLMII